MRRVRTFAAQAELYPEWRHFAFATNRTEQIELVEAEHREHAIVESHIADLKDGALAHFPSGEYSANSAWCVIACLAHNLARWSALIGLPDQPRRAPRTFRRRYLRMPGRLTRTARQWTLHLPGAGPGNKPSPKHSRRSGQSPRSPERRASPAHDDLCRSCPPGCLGLPAITPRRVPRPRSRLGSGATAASREPPTAVRHTGPERRDGRRYTVDSG